MIKYVELTAPNASAFRQAKILSIECKEGDVIKEGDTLFKVQSGSHQINLPAIKAGRIVELIATLQENITLSTALLLLETKVSGSTASQPLVEAPLKSKAVEVSATSPVSVKKEPSETLENRTETQSKTIRSNNKVTKKQHEQQSLNLMEMSSSSEYKEPTSSTKAIEQKNKEQKKQIPQLNDQHEQQEVVLTQTVTPPKPPAVKNTQKTSPTMSESSSINIIVPDIGADSAKVIEILVNIGDSVSAEDPLITLESDKASMDVPSPHSGVIKSIAVEIDQDISEGTVILELEASSPEATKPKKETNAKTDDTSSPAQAVTKEPSTSATTSSIVEVNIPDIGGDSAKVIEILVQIGDRVDVEEALVTLESDKASMDVPSPVAGIVKSIELAIDQDVSEGTLLATIDSTSVNADTNNEQVTAIEKPTVPEQTVVTTIEATPQTAPQTNQGKSHASPSIRRFARELGVDLSQLSGSGRKGRITQDDVKSFVKGELSKPATASSQTSNGTGIPAVPAQDFSKFGEVDIQPLNKIKKLTATNLHRSWLNVPHVTHNDEANINDLEAFRKQLNAEYAKSKQDIKLSPLAFIVKAMVNALQRFPQFNSSLESGGENLIYKKYFNIGIAVETPNGLVVPVLKDADKKSVAEIASEMGELAKKARDKKLTMNDMSGACITISSLGGIGGTGFTPIVNAPEVAILGVSRSKVQPVWNGSEFEPGMILPLSLSYDHRVIDGAEAARFTRHIAALLEDIRRLTV